MELTDRTAVVTGAASGIGLALTERLLDEGMSVVMADVEADRLTTAGLQRSRKLIVTESVFSMDGDFCALREIVQLKEQYGAWLLLDEAHATGLFGRNRRGLQYR